MVSKSEYQPSRSEESAGWITTGKSVTNERGGKAMGLVRMNKPILSIKGGIQWIVVEYSSVCISQPKFRKPNFGIY